MVDVKIQLPDGFLEEEIRCGYTVTRKMKEVWAIELDLLREFDTVCQRNGIGYYADGGTVLGAVRHKGFIPWDDDIDIGMDRDNYEKLCGCASEFSYPYFFQTEETDHGCYRGHAQLRRTDTTAILESESKWRLPYNQGIFIDIFPLDKLPDHKRAQKKYLKRMEKMRTRYARLYGICQCVPSPNKIKWQIKKICSFWAGILNKRYHLVDRYYQEYELEKARYRQSDTKLGANIQMTSLADPKVFDISYLNREPVRMDFEFMKVPVPDRYEDYLTSIYGDYKVYKMGTNCHGNVIFDTDKSYREYLQGR